MEGRKSVRVRVRERAGGRADALPPYPHHVPDSGQAVEGLARVRRHHFIPRFHEHHRHHHHPHHVAEPASGAMPKSETQMTDEQRGGQSQ